MGGETGMPKLTKQKGETVYLGIDPGKTGGIVILSSIPGYSRETLIPMPQTEHDLWQVFDALRSHGRPVTAVIEKVWGMPGQSSVAMFNFGQGYGSLRLALTAIGAEWEEITPQAWMKALSIPSGKKGEDKAAKKLKLKVKAQQLYPKLGIWNEAKYKQMAICDALLIATYCKRKHEGKL